MKCENQIQFCRVKCSPCDYSGNEELCPRRVAEEQNHGGVVPDFRTVKSLYAEMHGPVLSDHCLEVLRDVARFMRDLKISETDPVSRINHDTLAQFALIQDIRNVSKIGICARMSSFIGRRERTFYRQRGFDVRAVDIPEIEDDTRAYSSRSKQDILKIHKWFRSLQFCKDGRYRIFALLMLHYGMRNGDVRNLRWNNIHSVGEEWLLEYTPHKTEKSAAGRTVKIFLTPEDQVELTEFKGTASDDSFVIPRRGKGTGFAYLERQMNKSLRTIGITGSKGLYELRKLSIDAVFHSCGAETASAFSGDNFKTIKKHYCDTSSVVMRGVSTGMFSKIGSAA